MVDGPITIPLMKRTGFPAHFAAGVEAVASTGGQIMPPIMGAAAFVMAEYLAVSYFQVTLWAIIPALLYYVACFAAVHFEAKRRGLLGVPRIGTARACATCCARAAICSSRSSSSWPACSTAISAPLAALVGTLACFPVAMLRRSTRKDLHWRLVIEAMRRRRQEHPVRGDGLRLPPASSSA